MNSEKKNKKLYGHFVGTRKERTIYIYIKIKKWNLSLWDVCKCFLLDYKMYIGRRDEFTNA